METVDRSNILNINIGILGHVDSGKTSLVKALSTSLSTAALDKNPQSQQRGITLDLGFSAFTLPVPDHLKPECNYEYVQYTLVDCPGHASLIRTIIGGAQIIDMMLLVVDANKGIQTQTAECIVIGEITTNSLVVVLNKVDMIPEEERQQRIERVTKKIRKVFMSTKFANAPIVLTSAAVGGEKVASIGGVISKTHDIKQISNSLETQGIDKLVELIQRSVRLPKRNTEGPLYFAIDHCFAIKGHGTVLTGTVLSGTLSVNDIIEIPHVQIQRKVKSMQVFRKPVRTASQGDRVGVCVTNLDPKLIERAVAATPGTVPQLTTVICMVKKVRFFHPSCRSNTKFHVSVGHTTVIATVTFYGAKELVEMLQLEQDSKLSVDNDEENGQSLSEPSKLTKASKTVGNNTGTRRLNGATVDERIRQSALDAAAYQQSFPERGYPWNDDFEYQEEILGSEDLRFGNEPVQWALMQFQQPVFCPIGSLVIGSRLDADTKETSGSGAAHQCRLAFYGPVRESITEEDLEKIRIFHWKTKTAEVFRLNDVRSNGLCYELIGWKLFSECGSVNPFLGMHIETDKKDAGIICGAFGSGGKFRVKFPKGTQVENGSTLTLRFKRFLYDKNKGMNQSGMYNEIEDSTLLDDSSDTNAAGKMVEEAVVPVVTAMKPKQNGLSVIRPPKPVLLMEVEEEPKEPPKKQAESAKNPPKIELVRKPSASVKPVKLLAVNKEPSQSRDEISKKPVELPSQLAELLQPKEVSKKVEKSLSTKSSKKNGDGLAGVKSTNEKASDMHLHSINSGQKSSSELGKKRYADIVSGKNEGSHREVNGSVTREPDPQSQQVSNDASSVDVTPAASSKAFLTIPKATEFRIGCIDALKNEMESPSGGSNDKGLLYETAIVKDAFRMEENIRPWIGASIYLIGFPGGGTPALPTGLNVSGDTEVVLPLTSDSDDHCIGKLTGPFAKLGKLKASFSGGLRSEVGARVVVLLTG